MALSSLSSKRNSEIELWSHWSVGVNRYRDLMWWPLLLDLCASPLILLLSIVVDV